MQELLSIPETAKILSISVSSLYRLTSQHKIPHIKIGARVVFQPDKLNAWLNSQVIKVEGGAK